MSIAINLGLNSNAINSQNVESNYLDKTKSRISENIVIRNQNIDSVADERLQEATIIKVIEEANKKFDFEGRGLEFSIHEKTKQIMITVIDKANDEIIREIPSEKILDMVAAMCEGAGLLVDKKV